MDNIEFNAYVTDVFRLVRTMVIKIEALAKRDNDVLEAAGYPVGYDKTQWRYYMNLNGDYHPTDTVMKVTSIDTGEEIVFSKENALTHLQTFREYRRGGYLFKRLTELFPGQTELIKGILSPIPYEETIEAKDYKILRYNKNLVLWNEDQLIPRLQQRINNGIETLFGHEYLVTDNLMLPMSIKLFAANLFKSICLIRHAAIGTRYAHDFYIWSHIDSYGDYSRYKASLSKFQIMWLYHNIAWLKQNSGQQYTLDKLIKNLLTHSEIPIAKYDLVENTETQLEDLTPNPLYRKLHLNLQERYGAYATYIDTNQMTVKQQPLAKENFDQTEIWYEDALAKGRYSLQSELPTKALESKMADYTNRHLNTKMSVAFNSWIYLAYKKIYNGRVLVTDPKTGKQYRLPVGDAYYIWRFLVDQARGERPSAIEPAYYHNVLKAKLPTAAEIYHITGRQFFRPNVLAYDIRAHWTSIASFIAPEYLMSYAEEVYGIMWNHTKMYSQYYDLNQRARVKAGCDFMYESGIATLTDVKTYDDLMDRYELRMRDYSPEECRNFAWEVFKQVTGWDSSTNPSLRIKQSQLIDIMSSLSSYTIQVIKEMDDGQETTEMPNEIFIGDPRLVNGGNVSYLDPTKINFDPKTRIDVHGSLEQVTPLVADPIVEVKATTQGFATFPDDNVFKLVDLSDDVRDYAVKLREDGYFRLYEGDTRAIPPEVLPPLEYPDLESYIRATYYGRLVYKPVNGTDESGGTNSYIYTGDDK